MKSSRSVGTIAEVRRAELARDALEAPPAPVPTSTRPARASSADGAQPCLCSPPVPQTRSVERGSVVLRAGRPRRSAARRRTRRRARRGRARGSARRRAAAGGSRCGPKSRSSGVFMIDRRPADADPAGVQDVAGLGGDDDHRVREARAHSAPQASTSRTAGCDARAPNLRGKQLRERVVDIQDHRRPRSFGRERRRR